MTDTDRSLTVSVDQAAALLGISRGLAYRLVEDGVIPSVRLGRRIVVPRKGLDELLDRPEPTEPAPDEGATKPVHPHSPPPGAGTKR